MNKKDELFLLQIKNKWIDYINSYNKDIIYTSDTLKDQNDIRNCIDEIKISIGEIQSSTSEETLINSETLHHHFDRENNNFYNNLNEEKTININNTKSEKNFEITNLNNFKKDKNTKDKNNNDNNILSFQDKKKNLQDVIGRIKIKEVNSNTSSANKNITEENQILSKKNNLFICNTNLSYNANSLNLNKDYKNNLNKNNEESYKIDEWENSRSNKNKISNNTNFLQSTKKKSKNFL